MNKAKISESSVAAVKNHGLLVLAVVCVLFAAADLLYVKHPHVKYERWFNFYGFYALLATALIVFVSRAVRNVIERRADYYDG